MKTKFLSLVLLALLTVSCQKDLTLRLITSSKLTVKVVDSQGASIANVKVKLYDRANISSSSSYSSSYYSSLEYISSESTDANGKVDFGDIAAGTYYILIDSVRINGLNYQPAMQFQVNSAVDKNITINPEDYATTFNFSIKKAETSKTSSMVNIGAFSNLNILLIPSSSYTSYYSLDQLISLAEVTGKTNDVGNVSLKVPAFRSYVAIVYNDAKTVFSPLNYSSYSSSEYTGDKGETANYNYTLDSKTLLKTSFGIYNLSIKTPVSSSTSTSPTILPFGGLNVAAIPSGSNYDSSVPLSVLLESAELSGKTDADGKISFSLKSGVNYIFVVYNNDKTAYNILSSSPYSSFYVNNGETRQASFTISPTSLSPVVYTSINVALRKTSSVYYTSYPTDATPFSNLQVALVPEFSTNSSSSIDELLSKAIASGATDANGQISFVVATPSSSNYSYYQIVAYNADKTAKFVSSSFYIYSGNSTSKSYTLNSTTLATVN